MPVLRPACLAVALASLCLAFAGFAGCASQQHDGRALEPAAMQAQWLAASPDDPALREPFARQGIDTRQWPLPAWDADALTALALARHPELAVARAEVRSADAAATVARQRAGRTVDTTLEHHSADGASSSPWTVGFAFDGLWTGAARRAAQGDAGDARTERATVQAAQTAWSLRQRIHAEHRALAFAQQRVVAADAVLTLQRALSASARNRLALGAGDRLELAPVLDAEATAAEQAAQARDAVQRSRQALAAAVGLPGEQLARMTLRLDPTAEPAVPHGDDLALQRAALLNRLDLLAALASYRAADATLRAELAHQWPDLVLRPGLAWDQGDSIWSFGLAINLPPGGRNQAPIAEALAQRDLEAARCAELQASAIAALDAARQQVDAAAVQRELAQQRLQRATERQQQAERQLQRGDADRPAVLAARVSAASAQLALIDAQAARWAAVATLEDALQMPLPPDAQAKTDAPDAPSARRLASGPAAR